MKTKQQKLIDSIVNLIPKGQQTYYQFNWVSTRFLVRKRINQLLEENDNKH